MKKRLLIILGLSLILIFIVLKQGAQSRTKVYYSGRAVTFENQLVFGTTNTGAMEIFTLKNGKIVRTASLKPKFVSLPKSSDNFHDLEFDILNGRLYVYTIDGVYLYKFDITDPYNPILKDKIRDNSWDWFMQLDMTDDRLVTIGYKDIKYWDKDLNIINSYDVEHGKPENVKASRDGEYIIVINENVLQLYSTKDRKVTASTLINAKEDNIKGVHYDSVEKEVYVADDEALKVFDTKGRLLRKFKHTSDFGYDVESSRVGTAVYFSDGIGIVKNDKFGLNALDWEYTTKYTKDNSWTMGIEVSADNTGDKIIAFNNSEILVLDKNLELVDLYKSTVIDESPIENLNLVLDKKQAVANEYIVVSGAGYAPNEEIRITMGKNKWTASTDANGRFKRTIQVLDIRPQMIDIKADGLVSGLTYSISFKVN